MAFDQSLTKARGGLPAGDSVTLTKPQWYVYMLECADRSLYTGVTTDLERRIDEHNNGAAGAKYTRARRPVRLVYSETAAGRSEACQREAEIKNLSRAEKLLLTGAIDTN